MVGYSENEPLPTSASGMAQVSDSVGSFFASERFERRPFQCD